MVRRALAALAWSVVLVGSMAQPASAQANYRTAPIGGRSQLLGGTGMTFGSDAAMGFLNPATAVLVEDSRLAFSVNFYAAAYAFAPSWYAPGPIAPAFGGLVVDHPSTSSITFNALPSSLCLFFRAGDVEGLSIAQKDERTRTSRVGFCLATIQAESFGTTADLFDAEHPPGVSRQAQSILQSYTRFAAGPTYAIQVTPALSLGGSIHANLATHRSLTTSDTTTFGSSPTPIDTSFYRASRGDSFDFTALGGATLRFGRQTVGLSVRSPSLHVYGVGAVNEQTHFDGAGTQTQLLTARGSFVSRSPLRVGLGTGFEGSWGQAEIDLFYDHSLGEAYSAELDGHQTTTRGGVVDDRAATFDLNQRATAIMNVAAGVELVASPTISVLLGASSDLSAVPQGALASTVFNYFPQSTDRLAGSLGVGSHGAGGEVIIGAELAYGWGQRVSVNPYQLPPTETPTSIHSYQLTFVIAGATNLKTLKRAVEDIRDVIRQRTEEEKEKIEDRLRPSPSH
jgi:hypothetical protein